MFTVRDLLELKDISIDVCDDFDERCWIAYESGYKLTKEGKERFARALDIEVIPASGLNAWTLKCDNRYDATACHDLFYSLAGFCGEKWFDRWFEEV